MKMDVLFVAEDYRPGWLGYGAGWLCGGWTATWWIVWLWKSTGWWSVLVGPLTWALGFVLTAQVLFGVGTLLARLLRLSQKTDRILGGLLVVLAISWLAWNLMRSDAKAEVTLGWIWWIVLALMVLSEIGVKWKRRHMKSADIRQMAQKASSSNGEVENRQI